MKKEYLLEVLMTFILFTSCIQTEDDCDQHNEVTKTELSTIQKNRSPYFASNNIDTIRFLTSLGDTVIFKNMGIDSFWYTVTDNRNPDCINKRQDWYQILHKRYYNILTSEYLDFYYSYLKKIYISPKNGDSFELYDAFEFIYNGHHHIFATSAFGNKFYYQYYGDLEVNSKIFSDAIYNYHELTDSSMSIAYFNRNSGLLKFEDKKNNIIWTTLNP